MPTIALLTDFGLRDVYVGMLKAVITRINPGARVIDITHDVQRHDVRQAAWLLKHSYHYFAKGTIFVCVVDPEVGSKRSGLLVQTKHYFFIGPDNGALSLAARADGIKRIIKLCNLKYCLNTIASTFHGRDIFAPAAGHLASGVAPLRLGRLTREFKTITLPTAQVSGDRYCAVVLYADVFGNLITNIKKDDFFAFVGTDNFAAFVGNATARTITHAYAHYAQAKHNQPFFIESSFGYLEIALKNGSAQKYFKLTACSDRAITVKKI